MKTLKWLGLVAVLAVALAIITAVFGESPLWIVAYFVVVFAVFHYLAGGGHWLRTLFGALTAAAVYTIYLQVFAASTLSRQVAAALLLGVLASPLVVRFIRDNGRCPQQS